MPETRQRGVVMLTVSTSRAERGISYHDCGVFRMTITSPFLGKVDVTRLTPPMITAVSVNSGFDRREIGPEQDSHGVCPGIAPEIRL